MSALNVYGTSFLDEDINDGKLYHATTYIDLEVPECLKDELLSIIEDKINKFEKQCMCSLCTDKYE